jgi:hypothetical protein
VEFVNAWLEQAKAAFVEWGNATRALVLWVDEDDSRISEETVRLTEAYAEVVRLLDEYPGRPNLSMIKGERDE